ncbi:response regulator [Ferruginibacter sp. SUN106]|uniref:response regulator n=1 Tax=Ferruginibacter sp. SUN106 TaxID=2978348 RepID=UPI003D36E774
MLRILIADDHTVVRKGLRQILTDHFKEILIEEVAEAESLIDKVITAGWDVVISDINMPGRSGLDALKQIRAVFPGLPVLFFSSHPEEHYAIRVLKSGASGYLCKDSASEVLVNAVEKVLQGKKYFSPYVIEQLVNYIDADFRKLSYEYLSNREFDVMRLLASGKSVSDIAEKLSLSVTTVSTYRRRIIAKTGLRSNYDITKYAIENQLL